MILENISPPLGHAVQTEANWGPSSPGLRGPRHEASAQGAEQVTCRKCRTSRVVVSGLATARPDQVGRPSKIRGLQNSLESAVEVNRGTALFWNSVGRTLLFSVLELSSWIDSDCIKWMVDLHMPIHMAKVFHRFFPCCSMLFVLLKSVSKMSMLCKNMSKNLRREEQLFE